MIIAVYKEKGFTSRDVVNRIKEATGRKKAGHAGTLDPLAEGVLVVGIDREATKELHKERFEEKEYVAVVRFGMYSETDDEEGNKENVEVKRIPKVEEINKVLSSFSGEICQRPPSFSAVKVKGKEAYKWTREGKEVDLEERKVHIKKIRLLSYRYPLLKIKIITGRGVYVRSLARDVGKSLGVGGYLLSLLRTRVGDLTLGDCKQLEYFNGLK